MVVCGDRLAAESYCSDPAKPDNRIHMPEPLV